MYFKATHFSFQTLQANFHFTAFDILRNIFLKLLLTPDQFRFYATLISKTDT